MFPAHTNALILQFFVITDQCIDCTMYDRSNNYMQINKQDSDSEITIQSDMTLAIN